MFKMKSILKKPIRKCARKMLSLSRQSGSPKRVTFADLKESEAVLQPIRDKINAKFQQAKHEIFLLGYTGDFDGFTEDRQRELEEFRRFIMCRRNQQSDNDKSLANSDSFAEKSNALEQSRPEILEIEEINQTGCKIPPEGHTRTQHIVVEDDPEASLRVIQTSNLDPIPIAREKISIRFQEAKHTILLLGYMGEFNGFTEDQQMELEKIRNIVKCQRNKQSNIIGKSLVNSGTFEDVQNEIANGEACQENQDAAGQSCDVIPEIEDVSKTGGATPSEIHVAGEQHVVIEEDAAENSLSDNGPRSITVRCLEGDFNVVIGEAAGNGSFPVLSVTSVETGAQEDPVTLSD